MSQFFHEPSELRRRRLDEPSELFGTPANRLLRQFWLEGAGPKKCKVIHKARVHKNPEASMGDDIAGRLL
jgi:hypothetical protein